MKIFAIELSSKEGSIALLENSTVLGVRSWTEDFKNRQQLFDAIADLAQELELDWAEVDQFAVGRGPGAFSGMRISLSIANTLAQPAEKPVHTISSGEVLAAQIAEQSDCPHIAVIGDARRNRLWFGLFTNENGAVRLEGEFELIECGQLVERIPVDTLVVSPDTDRLSELLEDFKTPEHGVEQIPNAVKLGQLAAEKIEAGIPSEGKEPLYMHPPVFVKPRFPAG